MKVSRGCCSSSAKGLGKRLGAENIGDGGSKKLLFVFGDQWFVKEIGNSKTAKTVSVVSKRSGEDIGDKLKDSQDGIGCKQAVGLRYR